MWIPLIKREKNNKHTASIDFCEKNSKQPAYETASLILFERAWPQFIWQFRSIYEYFVNYINVSYFVRTSICAHKKIKFLNCNNYNAWNITSVVRCFSCTSTLLRCRWDHASTKRSEKRIFYLVKQVEKQIKKENTFEKCL